MNIKEKLKKYFGWKTLIGVAIGGTAGYLYYYFIGCNSGSCPITSNPWNSVFYGSLLGMIWTVK